MRNIYTLLLAVGMLMFMSLSSFAATYGNGTDAGAVFTVDSSNVDGSTSIVFKPSPKVKMQGATDTNGSGFAHQAWHTQAQGTKGGSAYGMAYDTNKLFFRDISQSTSTTPVAISVSNANSTAFQSSAGTSVNSYYVMQ